MVVGVPITCLCGTKYTALYKSIIMHWLSFPKYTDRYKCSGYNHRWYLMGFLQIATAVSTSLSSSIMSEWDTTTYLIVNTIVYQRFRACWIYFCLCSMSLAFLTIVSLYGVIVLSLI